MKFLYEQGYSEGFIYEVTKLGGRKVVCKINKGRDVKYGKYLVRCANMHDELAAALDDMLYYVEERPPVPSHDLHSYNDMVNVPHYKESLEKFRNLLKKAKGE